MAKSENNDSGIRLQEELQASVFEALKAHRYVASLMERTGLDVVELFAASLACYDEVRRETDDMGSEMYFHRPDGEQVKFDPLGH